jgi:electron transfer flavoprotein alpha subunit
VPKKGRLEDEEAAIFSVADCGLVGNLFAAVSKFSRKIHE